MDEHRTDEPEHRLTRLCLAMVEAMEEHPEAEGNEKVIVMIQDGDQGGIQLSGYEDDAEATSDLMQHAKAFLRTTGHNLHVAYMDRPPGQG